jgi:hypothetical protein
VHSSRHGADAIGLPVLVAMIIDYNLARAKRDRRNAELVVDHGAIFPSFTRE